MGCVNTKPPLYSLHSTKDTHSTNIQQLDFDGLGTAIANVLLEFDGWGPVN